jgi:DNA-directed RNA polymerase specialized sigma24 family protein
MRWYKSDTLDLLPCEPPPFRSDKLREHVDSLPQPERTIVSRHYFGQEPLRGVALEIGLTEAETKRCLNNALAILQARVIADHKAMLKDEEAVRQMPSAGTAEARALVPGSR